MLNNPYYWISYYSVLGEFDKVEYWTGKISEYKESYNEWKDIEDAYIESQIIKNRKWHSFYYFLRYLITGRD